MTTRGRLALGIGASALLLLVCLWSLTGERTEKSPPLVVEPTKMADISLAPPVALSRVKIDPPPEAPTSPAKSLETSEATLWVEVVSKPTGAPIEGVWVAISELGIESFSGEGVPSLEGRLDDFPTTNAQGQARFFLPPGSYSLHVMEPGFSSRVSVDIPSLLPGEVRTEHVELPTENDLLFLGRVVDEASGQAIEGAEVLLFRGNSWGSTWPIYQPSGVIAELARTHSDSAGRFRLRPPSWKGTMVRVEAPGHVTGFAAVQRDQKPEEVVLRIGSAATLIAKVSHAGGLLPGIRLSVTMEGGWIAAGDLDPSGVCRFEKLPTGRPLQFQLTWPEPEMPETGVVDSWPFPHHRLVQYLPELVLLSPGEVREENWTLHPRCTLRGIARDEAGLPCQDLTLQLLRREVSLEPRGQDQGRIEAPWSLSKFPDIVVTDDQGAFEIPDLPSGQWWLGPPPPNIEDIASSGTVVTIPEGATDLRVDVVARRER